MGNNIENEGYFSILKWRRDATRNEARNIAVILVEPDGRFGGIKSAPLSGISKSLHEQGILDSLIVGMEERFRMENKPNLEELKRMHNSLQRSLCFTDPRPVIVHDVDAVLNALYKAYAAPTPARSSAMTRYRILDNVVTKLRRHGHKVRRGEYVKDFIFDAVIEGEKRHQQVVAEVLSFGTAIKDWTPTEKAAGHFLYALEKLNVSGFGIFQPPVTTSHKNASLSYKRILGWFAEEEIPTIRPDELDPDHLPLNGGIGNLLN